MSGTHEDSSEESQHRATIFNKKADEVKEFEPKYKVDEELRLRRPGVSGSILCVVEEIGRNEQNAADPVQYKVKDPDTKVTFVDWYPEKQLRRA